MGWIVQVDPGVRPCVAALDIALRDELVEHVERIADEPATMLHRPGGAETAGLYEYRYRSAVDANLEFVLRFDGFDGNPRRLVLVHVNHTSRADPAK